MIPGPGDPKTPRRPKRRPRRPPRAKPTTPRDARGSTRKVPFGHQRVLFVPSTFPLSRPTISTRRENRMPARGGRRRGTHERFALRRSDRSDHETRCRKQRVLVSQERRRSTHVFAGSRVSRRLRRTDGIRSNRMHASEYRRRGRARVESRHLFCQCDRP